MLLLRANRSCRRRPGPVRLPHCSSPAPGRPRRGAVTGTVTDSDDGSLEVWLLPGLGPLYSHGPDWARCHRYATLIVYKIQTMARARLCERLPTLASRQYVLVNSENYSFMIVSSALILRFINCWSNFRFTILKSEV